MQKTTNCNLNLYEPTDDFLRTSFNSDTQIIDTALGTLTKGLAAVSNLKLVAGRYTGNALGSSMSGTIQTISLGFRPSFVFIRQDINGISSSSYDLDPYSALVLDGYPLVYSGVTQCSVTNDGFYVTLGIVNSAYVFPVLNRSDIKYLFIAAKG